tara:strand:+ start:11427 stop:11789 length:363 start_codon:yes stop_codon:yes gene_type:complete
VKKLVSALCLLCVFLSGCAHRIADLTVASNRNINLNSGALITGEQVEGDDYIPVVLLPLGVATIENAIDNAVEGDRCIVGLSNIVVEYVRQSFFVGRVGFHVKGNAVYDSNLKGCEHKKI